MPSNCLTLPLCQEDPPDSEVERDIAKALKVAGRQPKSEVLHSTLTSHSFTSKDQLIRTPSWELDLLLLYFSYSLNFSSFLLPLLQSILHMVSWFRVILDEAHMIKDRSTSTAKAVFNLNSLNKWCLSGTPLQNRVGELYSLVRFLRVDPHAFYYCKRKDCNCKSLHYR